MASYAIITHGGRGAGTSTGTYVIPKNVTIYFFTEDTELMGGSGGGVIEDNLLTNHPKEIAVQALATEVKRAYETIPNYEMSGDNFGPGTAFRYATGVYRVGQLPSVGLVQAVPPNTTKRLSDLIGGKHAIGITIYWLACRAAPTKFTDISSTSTTKTTLLGHSLAQTQIAGSLKPSQVKKYGGIWI